MAQLTQQIHTKKCPRTKHWTILIAWHSSTLVEVNKCTDEQKINKCYGLCIHVCLYFAKSWNEMKKNATTTTATTENRTILEYCMYQKDHSWQLAKCNVRNHNLMNTYFILDPPSQASRGVYNGICVLVYSLLICLMILALSCNNLFCARFNHAYEPINSRNEKCERVVTQRREKKISLFLSFLFQFGCFRTFIVWFSFPIIRFS